MFLNLRKGSSVYVLDTRETPKFYVATVKEIGMPYYPQPTPGQLTPFQQQYINIVLDNNESWGVRTNMDVESKDGLTVSMTREGLMPAITAAQGEHGHHQLVRPAQGQPGRIRSNTQRARPVLRQDPRAG